MEDYSKGKIYKIFTPNHDKIYIGSTIQTLNERFSRHSTEFNDWKKEKQSFCTSFLLLELGDTQITLIENFPCESKQELRWRERHYFDITSNKVNKVRPIVTAKERKMYRKKWRKANPDKEKETRKRSSFKNKDYYENYYLENKEKINKKNNDNYKKNREKKLQQNKTWQQNNLEKKREISKNYRIRKRVKECLDNLISRIEV